MVQDVELRVLNEHSQSVQYETFFWSVLCDGLHCFGHESRLFRLADRNELLLKRLPLITLKEVAQHNTQFI